MPKCVKCNKLISKKVPGIQCGKCSKWYHASCIPISHEQLTTLSATDAVEWKCRVCISQYKQKRLSAILPDPDEEDNSDAEQVIVMKDNFSEDFLKELRNDIRNAIKDEMQRTLKFYSAKIDDFQQKMEQYEEDFKHLEKQHKELQHKHSNLQLKYETLNQKINSMEQGQMENKIEICGINKEDKENITEITQKIAQKMNLDPGDVVTAYRKERRAAAAQQRVQSTIVVTLKEGRRDTWLESAKCCTVTPRDLGKDDDGKIFMREALTPATAFLLWKTKNELKKDNQYKFVWCKRGTVLVRKDDNAKIQTVRSESDIDKLKKVTT